MDDRPPQTPPPQPARWPCWWIVTLSLAAGVTVFVLTFRSGFLNHEMNHRARYAHGLVRHYQQLAQAYIADTGQAPDDLVAVIQHDMAQHPSPGPYPAPKPSDATKPLDIWMNPCQLLVDGDAVDVVSLGADGKPGGEGINRDVHANQPFDDAQYRLTLTELLRSGEAGVVWQISTIAALATVGIMLFSLIYGARSSPPKSRRDWYLSGIMAALIVVLLAWFVGSIHVAAHVASGH